MNINNIKQKKISVFPVAIPCYHTSQPTSIQRETVQSILTLKELSKKNYFTSVRSRNSEPGNKKQYLIKTQKKYKKNTKSLRRKIEKKNYQSCSSNCNPRSRKILVKFNDFSKTNERKTS